MIKEEETNNIKDKCKSLQGKLLTTIVRRWNGKQQCVREYYRTHGDLVKIPHEIKI